MAWITTKDGRRVNTDWFDDKPIISKYSGDEITRKMALNSWAKNASGIKAASQGQKYDGSIFGKVGLNDEAKAEHIINYVKGSTVSETTYRGMEDLSDKLYAKYTKVGNTFSEKGLTSWTTEKRIAVGYGSHNKNAIVFVANKMSNARKLGDVAGTGNEEEVIAYNQSFKIQKVEKRKYSTFVYLGGN